jgi:hypothetical protein
MFFGSVSSISFGIEREISGLSPDQAALPKALSGRLPTTALSGCG